MRFVEIGRRDLSILRKRTMDGDAEAMECLAFLDDVRFAFCNMLDEVLVYQGKHPVYKLIRGTKGFVDLKQIQYVSNKLSKQLENYDDFSTMPSENSQVPELDNMSEVQLLTLEAK